MVSGDGGGGENFILKKGKINTIKDRKEGSNYHEYYNTNFDVTRCQNMGCDTPHQSADMVSQW